MSNTNAYANLGGGALDQELFKKKPGMQTGNSQDGQVKETLASPTPNQNNKIEEKNNCQLNAWITTNQDQLLNSAYYRLRANRVKIKKGELIGIAIEVISRILENQSPSHPDVSILDTYINEYEKKK
jgi:hypothetical protein